MAARLRYFTITSDPTGFLYLHSIADSRYGVSIGPIGPCFLSNPPWDQHMGLFGKPTADLSEIVNIVCAPRGLRMGTSFGDYEPETAFEGLLTAGVPNVAIVTSGDGKGDIEALKSYSLVIAPNDRVCAQLTDDGIPAIVLSHGDFPNELEPLLERRKTPRTQGDTQDARIAEEIDRRTRHPC
jgi:hypothetical protein